MRKKIQNQHISEGIEIRGRSFDSGALQIRNNMLAEMGKVRNSGYGYTEVLRLLGMKESLEVIIAEGVWKL